MMQNDLITMAENLSSAASADIYANTDFPGMESTAEQIETFQTTLNTASDILSRHNADLEQVVSKDDMSKIASQLESLSCADIFVDTDSPEMQSYEEQIQNAIFWANEAAEFLQQLASPPSNH